MSELDAGRRDAINRAFMAWWDDDDESTELADALAPLVAGWLAEAWDAGHQTPKRYGPDDCRCSAWNEDECACGRYGSNVITPNPYRGGDDG